MDDPNVYTKEQKERIYKRWCDVLTAVLPEDSSPTMIAAYRDLGWEMILRGVGLQAVEYYLSNVYCETIDSVRA
jgi:hypothetical protein